ncbi:MAG: hypothetical protein JW751_31480 [Polyangiaceae bacterium]|nr:hypothetical protein [Polyangiaceae bacterium]
MAPDALEGRRVAVVRGRVVDRSGKPAVGVRVRVLGQPQLGTTLTRADGAFDLVVNGGGPITIACERDDLLPVHRPVEPRWCDYAYIEDVVMIPVDPVVTRVELGSSTCVARGSEVSDESGKRTSTLLFTAGTGARAVLADGSTKTLSSLSVRATEFTVGPEGLRAMPAPLPLGTGYTYAVDLTVDEALAAGAREVRFDAPVLNYVENFLGFPVGTPVPVGYYDREQGVWIPEEDGRVIRIAGVRGDLADVDAEGRGAGSSDDVLAKLEVTEAERRELARLYAPGQELWRVRLHHFSPYDFNWPVAPPKGARPPGQPPPAKDRPRDRSCEKSGSIIDVHNQVLGEQIGVPGTPFSLCYRSSRTPGVTTARTLEISVTGDSVPPNLLRVELEIVAAGNRVARTFPPAPNQRFTYVWDGKDAYLRALRGEARVDISLRWIYPGEYQIPASEARSFGRGSPTTLPSNGRRAEYVMEQRWTETLALEDVRPLGLGGWALDVHHAYDPVSGALRMGTGETRSARDVDETRVVAGGGEPEDDVGDGGEAAKARLVEPLDIAIGADGCLWIADRKGGRVRRVDPRGNISTVAGGVSGLYNIGYKDREGKLATRSDDVVSVWGVRLFAKAVLPGMDGGFFVLEDPAWGDPYVLYRVAPDGVIRRVAGAGSAADGLGDGGPALDARLIEPIGIAAAPGGGLYVLDFDSRGNDKERWGGRVRFIGTDGVIRTVIGGARSAQARLEGSPATEVPIGDVQALAVGPDGSLYLAENSRGRVRRVSPDGTIRTIAGAVEYSSIPGDWGDGGPASQAVLDVASIAVADDGRVYVYDDGRSSVRIIAADGTIRALDGIELSAGARLSRAPSGAILGVGKRYDDKALVFFKISGEELQRLGTVGPFEPSTLQLSEDVLEGFESYSVKAVLEDGTTYLGCAWYDQRSHAPHEVSYLILRRTPDGRVIQCAGSGLPEDGFGDGGSALEAEIRELSGLTAAADGSLYFLDRSRIRRVSPDGRISTVVRGTDSDEGEREPGSKTDIGEIQRFALGPDGSVYFVERRRARPGADEKTTCIWRLAPDGMLALVAGGGLLPAVDEDGIPASDYHVRAPRGFTVSPSGEVYILDGRRIRRIGSDMRLTTVPFTAAGEDGPHTIHAGRDGVLYIADESGVHRLGSDGIVRPVARGELGENAGRYRALAVAPDGTLHGVIGDRVVQIGKRGRGISLGKELALCDEDGTQLFVFDRKGRHLRTVQALTGQIVHAFEYDAEGRLCSVGDGQGNEARIEHDGSGNPTAIASSAGSRTSLSVNPEGYLAAITSPSGETIRIDYAQPGLLTSLTDPAGNISRYTYDDRGRLIKNERPDGSHSTLKRIESERGVEVVRRTAAGRVSRYLVEPRAGADSPAGASGEGGDTKITTAPDGTRTIAYPEGTTVTRKDQPDPRFGDQLPLLERATITKPSGLTTTMSMTRTVESANPDDPLEFDTLTDRVEVNGRAHTITFDRRNRQVVRISAMGRKSTVSMDERWRVIRSEIDGLDPAIYEYDAEGRLVRQAQGDQEISFRYQGDARPASPTESGGLVRSEYDQSKRTLRITDGEQAFQVSRDESGRVVSFEVPGGGRHEMARTAGRRLERYTAPDGATWRITYDADGESKQRVLPSGRTIERVYDGEGHLIRVESPEAIVEYDELPGGVERATRRLRDQQVSEEIRFAYDGSLFKEIVQSGTVGARFRYRYHDDHLLAGISLDDGPETSFEYDADGGLTRFGRFAVDRAGAAGAASAICDGTMRIDIEHDRAGRLTRRAHSVRGKPFYELRLGYDRSGRFVKRSETILGATHAREYVYDRLGQLAEVRRDGAVIERYEYDERGNCVSWQVEGRTGAARYDAADRLVEIPGVATEVDPDGFLRRYGEQVLRYGTGGELLGATVNGGETISFTWDPLGRMAARTDAAGTTGYLYGNLLNPLELSATRTTSGEVVHYHYSEAGQLIAVEQKGRLFYVATDPIGTPRVVVDEGGEPVATFEYDSFGRRTGGTGSFSLAVGFAGGLSDPRTGLVRFGARDYHPETGRWTAPDPILLEGGDTNLYRYVSNDPVSLTDPSGLNPVVFVIRAVVRDRAIHLAKSFLGAEYNREILLDFLFDRPERGSLRVYRDDGPQIQDMRHSYSAELMRQLYRELGCKGSSKNGPTLPSRDPRMKLALDEEILRRIMQPALDRSPIKVSWSTVGAFWETLTRPVNPTQAQVGAFSWGYQTNNDGTVTFTISNELTVKSFLLHASPDKWDHERGEGNWGGMGAIKQFFKWTEPNPCGCKK